LPPEDEQDGLEYSGFYGVLCNLVIAVLRVLLVRGHGYEKGKRLGGSETSWVNLLKTPSAIQQPHILQKITDFIQYHVFCRRLKEELDKTVETLYEVGIKVLLRFNPAGESSHQIIKLLTENGDRRLGGDASLYMDERYIYLTLLTHRWG
jgi:mediator of RNA polymerase II transcription subunit 17